MEHEEELSVKMFEKFKWKITNFTQLKNGERIHSEAFILGSYPWRIILYPLGDSLAIFLEAVQMKSDQYEVWNRDVKFRLTVFNQLNQNRTITKGEYKNEYNRSGKSWGYPSFMPLVEFHDPEKGFIVKDVCFVGVELFVRESKLGNQVDQVTSLERHPVVQNSTNDLQVLWEELKKYRTDLAWLEPHVQSALEIKNYVEKALEVEKLKENVVTQELETEKLKKKIIGI